MSAAVWTVETNHSSMLLGWTMTPRRWSSSARAAYFGELRWAAASR